MSKSDKLAQWARQNGYTFDAETDGFETEDARQLDSFGNWHGAKNHVVGECHNLRFEMLDFTTRHTSRSGSHGHTSVSYRDQTAVLLPGAAVEIPNFEIVPRVGGWRVSEFFGMGGLTLAADNVDRRTQEVVDAFSKHYMIYAGGFSESLAGHVGKADEPDLVALAEICKLNVFRLLTRKPGLFVESQGEHLALWCPGKVLSPDARSKFLRMAIELVDVLKRAKHEPSVPGIALQSGMNVSAGKTFAILGGGAGGFFFGAICGMVVAVVTDSRLAMLAFPLFAFGGMVVGAIIGKKLSRSL